MLTDRARAMRRLCFDPEPSEVDLQLLGSRERWLVYRELVRSRLVRVTEAALRRTRKAVGAEAFALAVDEWLSAGGPRTRYLRQVPGELAAVAISLWHVNEPPWVADLARYEIACWEARHAPPDPDGHEQFAFDRRPVTRAAMKVLRLEHPVHETPTPASGYEPGPTLLCVYRDANHEPATRKLNALAADLLESWQRADQTVAESVDRIAAKHQTVISPAFVEKLAILVADFLIGGHSPSP